jgi:hypothetical protein
MLRDKLKFGLDYLLARFMEVSTWKGITLIVAAGGWHRLDGSSKGEVIAQTGMLVFGLISVLLPQSTQYKQ